MIVKVLVAAALVAAPVPAQTPPPLAPPIPVVTCPVPGGASMGSAFRIGPRLLLSVAHVTHFPACYIDGEKVKVTYTSGDFSIITVSRPGSFLKVDCGGFVKGHKYLALGHPRGIDELVGVPMIATGQSNGGQAILSGIFEAQPGMSGGPIVDVDTLRVVGTVNTGNWEDGETGSVQLKDTAVCSKS
jgi:hypothetical protein